jgi:hypothetical protein
MYANPARQPSPFVYIIDSPSSNDLFEGYTIGMALRDALKAIRIPHFYTLAANREALNLAMQFKLSNCVNQMQPYSQTTDAIPLIHLCMHGNNDGVALTDNYFLGWSDLRSLLLSHNHIKGYDPFVCMASCNGINASSMVHAFDSVFSYLIGNTGPVYQNDLTVAYLSFYNHIFSKNATVDQSVSAMKAASGDSNFYYAVGQQIKAQKFQELQFGSRFPFGSPGI